MDKSSKHTNKINVNQKEMLVDFMLRHPELARNTLPNSCHGKALANELWSKLAAELNAEGPPTKDVKAWRKVFADQKHQAKKKICSTSRIEIRLKKKEGILSQTEQQIAEAAGLNDLSNNPFASPPMPPTNRAYTLKDFFQSDDEYTRESHLSDVFEENVEMLEEPTYEENEEDGNELYGHENLFKNEHHDQHTDDVPEATQQQQQNQNSVLHLLNNRLETFRESQDQLNSRLDKLLEINERALQMKEEEHAANMALKRMDLKIKSLELEILKTKSVFNILSTL